MRRPYAVFFVKSSRAWADLGSTANSATLLAKEGDSGSLDCYYLPL